MASNSERKSNNNTPPSPSIGPGSTNQGNGINSRRTRGIGSPQSIGPFRPKISPRKSANALSKSGRQADSSKKAEPGGPEPDFTNVPSPPPRKATASPEISSLMVSNLSLRDKSRLLQQSPLSHKRCAESPSQLSKRTRHSGPAFRDSQTDRSLPDPRAFDGHETPPSKVDAVTTWQHTAPGDPGRPSMPAGGDAPEGNTEMVLQPQTRPITQEQLINEVKGIYAGLVMVEKKCVEITQQRAKSANKLSNDQWQALTALHRTLLHEHHDFFLASQHPTASPALRRLANKYAMPARMWRHGIHSFLELLRLQLPDSLDHMLAFVYIAYSMMALLKESVPSFLETWIECLGDLARYRMAIEDHDMRDREVWSNVARTWYNQAVDRSPNVGRIQHHLAVLARPNIVQQLFYYSKALVSIVPFINARDSIMLLFSPLLEKPGKTNDRYSATEASLVTGCAYLFTRTSLSLHQHHAQVFLDSLDGHIARSSNKWKVQGPEVAASLIAGIMDFGKDDNPVWIMYQEYMTTVKGRKTLPDSADIESQDAEDTKIRDDLRQEFWTNTDLTALPRIPSLGDDSNAAISSISVTWNSLQLFASATKVNANKIGDKNIVPFMSFVLSFLLSLSYVGGPLIYVESHIPWQSIVTFLNTLGRSGVLDSRIEAESFPVATSGTGRQLPEDFYARGTIWAQHVFPADFFRHNLTDEDERCLELASHTAPRSERCLYLGIRLASLGRHIQYDTLSKQFSVTEYASTLQKGVQTDNALPHCVHDPAHHTLAANPHSDSASLQTDFDTTGTPTRGARTAETDSDYVVIDGAKGLQTQREKDLG